MIEAKMKALRLEHRLTLEELADTLNKKYPNTVNFNKGKLSKWENGKEEPKLSSIRILADFYSIKIDDFYSENTSSSSIETIYNQLVPPRQEKVYNYASEQLEEQNKIVSFPEKVEFNWYGYVSAGTGEYLTDDVCETIELDENDVPDNADFALTVNGDSMKPMFKDHELIFVEETDDVQSGSIAVVMIDNDAYVKKIYISMDHLTLVSLNPKYDDIVVKSNDGVKIIGKVVF